VVVPRERFSLTRRSLESLCTHTPGAFSLIYVDGGAPPGSGAFAFFEHTSTSHPTKREISRCPILGASTWYSSTMT
jgi:hypothetical protein